jgi:hypothetical protein
MSDQQQRVPAGGVVFNGWVWAREPYSFVSKTTGAETTVVELRDPRRLGNALVVYLDGEVGNLAGVPVGTPVTLHVEEVRSGRNRGELVGRAARADVEAAAARAVKAR